jgi:hypothetical protein
MSNKSESSPRGPEATHLPPRVQRLCPHIICTSGRSLEIPHPLPRLATGGHINSHRALPARRGRPTSRCAPSSRLSRGTFRFCGTWRCSPLGWMRTIISTRINSLPITLASRIPGAARDMDGPLHDCAPESLYYAYITSSYVSPSCALYFTIPAPNCFVAFLYQR